MIFSQLCVNIKQRKELINIKDTFANRLQKAINLSGLKPIEVASKTGLDKSLISCYLSGKYKAGDDNLAKLANVLNVSEAWLQGYDVDIKDSNDKKNISPLDELLYSKAKELSDEDKIVIMNVIDSIKKKIDEENGG